MSYTLNCQLSGWGTVRNPLDESEEIPVEDGQVVVEDGDLARALADEYGPLVIVDGPDEESEAPEAEGESEPPFDPAEHTVEELREEVDGLTDAEREALADAERDGEDRSSAIDVLEP